MRIEDNWRGNSDQIKRGINYTKVQPTPLEDPYVALLSQDCMNMIGLDERKQSAVGDDLLAEYLAGNKLFPGSDPLASCYCGYKFGYFVGQLGDGRAISLGDVSQVGDADWGSEGSLLDLQLKGSGVTPYSRGKNGRTTVKAAVREFLASEAMHYLGIPTTRAASMVVSEKTNVVLDKFYSEKPKEKCAVVLRVAPTLLRFGNFEIFNPVSQVTSKAGPSEGLKEEMMPPMLDYLLKNFYSEIDQSVEGDDE